MLVAMVANGAFRVAVLIPQLGEAAGQALSAALGIAIILLLSRPFIRALDAPGTKDLVGIAELWLVLTVAFEFLFGHYVTGRSWQELASDYDVTKGRLWPFVLLSLGAAPFLWAARFRQRRDPIA
jgi:hypothetical protein